MVENVNYHKFQNDSRVVYSSVELNARNLVLGTGYYINKMASEKKVKKLFPFFLVQNVIIVTNFEDYLNIV